MDFLNSMIQAFHDTMDDEFGRKRFWADVREEWLSRWDLTEKQNRVRGLFHHEYRTNRSIEALIPFPRRDEKAGRPPKACTATQEGQQGHASTSGGNDSTLSQAGGGA